MRTSVVVPIGVIVAVAILSVVIAVLSSAQRANDVALDIEQQLFMRALVERSDRVLREIESVAASQAAHRHMSNDFDPEWARMNVAEPLRSFFRHDVVFLATSEDYPSCLMRRPPMQTGLASSSCNCANFWILCGPERRPRIRLGAPALRAHPKWAAPCVSSRFWRVSPVSVPSSWHLAGSTPMPKSRSS
jgi:hypothetical protein